MPGEITGEEGNSECCDNLIPEVTIESSARRSDAKTPRKIYDLGLKYISDNKVLKKIIIAAAILVIALIIVIILLAVTKKISCPSCAPCESCPDPWFMYQGKYFFVSKEKINWPMSSNICSSLNASLAVIDTQEELNFFENILGFDEYWIGLSKKDQVRKWSSGTELTNQFPEGGRGFCPYVHGKVANSTICSAEKCFICSLPEGCRKAG